MRQSTLVIAISDLPPVQRVRYRGAWRLRSQTEWTLTRQEVRLPYQAPDRLRAVTRSQQVPVDIGQGDGQLHGAAESAQSLAPAVGIEQFRAPAAQVEVAQGGFFKIC